MAVLDAAINGTGIAQSGPMVTVLSPHQYNFTMPLTVEVWAGPIPDDLEDWDEAYEVWLDTDKSGLTFESPTLSAVAVSVPPGRYRALLTGRGFIARGWPGSTTPVDRWRIRLCAGDELGAPRHLQAGHFSTNPVGPATPVAPVVARAAQTGEELDVVAQRERQRAFELQAFWGGVEPSERLRTVGARARTLAEADRPLAEWIAAQPSPLQRRIALWAARTACTAAPTQRLNWEIALSALSSGDPLPAPFDNQATAWAALYAGTSTGTTSVVILTEVSSAGRGAARPAIDPPAAALATVLAAASESPAVAAFGALAQAVSARDQDQDLYDELRREFGV